MEDDGIRCFGAEKEQIFTSEIKLQHGSESELGWKERSFKQRG